MGSLIRQPVAENAPVCSTESSVALERLQMRLGDAREHGLTRKSHAKISNKPQNSKALEVLTPLSAQCIHSRQPLGWVLSLLFTEERKTQQHREVEPLSLDHTASKSQTWDLNLCIVLSLTPRVPLSVCGTRTRRPSLGLHVV